MGSTRINRLVAVALILSSVFVTLIGFEYFLTWENSFEPYPASRLAIEGKDYLFEYPVQNLFDESRPESKKPKLYVVGDSFVAGLACAKRQQDLSGHLQRLIGDTVEVVNLGVGGKDPSNYIDVLTYFPVRKGDKVVVVLYDNDIHMSRESCELATRQEKNWPVYVPTFCDSLISNRSVPKDEEGFWRHANQIVKRYKTFELLKEAIANLPYVSNWLYRSEYVSRWSDFDSEENRWIVSTIPVMKDIAEKRGAQFLLVYYPNTNAISSDDRRHKIWLSFIEHVFQTTQIRIDDPYPFFIQNARRRSMVWSLTDKHPSCDAHSIMAQYLYKLIYVSRNTPSRLH